MLFGVPSSFFSEKKMVCSEIKYGFKNSTKSLKILWIWMKSRVIYSFYNRLQLNALVILGEYLGWGSWSNCVNGQRFRTRSCVSRRAARRIRCEGPAKEVPFSWLSTLIHKHLKKSKIAQNKVIGPNCTWINYFSSFIRFEVFSKKLFKKQLSIVVFFRLRRASRLRNQMFAWPLIHGPSRGRSVDKWWR